ncbi:hypothetical protein CISG_07099 [Coccidioides immitis RMSCC 3703]|uniref:Uncharacterized protein n=2 Tax=Coccidioides immitis TaxID=5501 RepID=A0A0J8TWQ7_COCIT|nr:hypothetical protein CIRG_04498 [Coccidioides immitis RMSCC 2394]KMU78382.1 hypothetical protein CISG_07099 [Coccidioides immitis RMSCC 3703]
METGGKLEGSCTVEQSHIVNFSKRTSPHGGALGRERVAKPGRGGGYLALASVGRKRYGHVNGLLMQPERFSASNQVPFALFLESLRTRLAKGVRIGWVSVPSVAPLTALSVDGEEQAMTGGSEDCSNHSIRQGNELPFLSPSHEKIFRGGPSPVDLWCFESFEWRQRGKGSGPCVCRRPASDSGLVAGFEVEQGCPPLSPNARGSGKLGIKPYSGRGDVQLSLPTTHRRRWKVM